VLARPYRHSKPGGAHETHRTSVRAFGGGSRAVVQYAQIWRPVSRTRQRQIDASAEGCRTAMIGRQDRECLCSCEFRSVGPAGRGAIRRPIMRYETLSCLPNTNSLTSASRRSMTATRWETS
jgi:hypothetical protein